MATNTHTALVNSRESLERRERFTLLPDPKPSAVRVPIVSVDDHFVEPPDLFLKHMSARFGDRIPQVRENDNGIQFWHFEDVQEPVRSLITVAGRPKSEWTWEPIRFDEMRPASYKPVERVRDMDVAGVAMSMCFPSAMFGFAGQRFFRLKDRELGLAAMRAYNDWIIDEWVAASPDRLIPQQVPWFPDPVIAADEIRKNAARGFRAVAFSEDPEALGFASLYTDHWDPFFRACEETGTVVDLHIGSSSQVYQGSTGAPKDVALALFPVNAMRASVDWLYARIPLRFPGLKIVFSESGVSWIPMIHERLRRNMRMAETAESTWLDQDRTPEEVFKSAYWFTSIEDPSGIAARHDIGIDRIMLEVDYPHPDSSWPDTQDVVYSEIGHLPEHEQQLLGYRNACEVYGLSVDTVQRIIAGFPKGEGRA